MADKCDKQAAGNPSIDTEVKYSKVEIKTIVENKCQTLWDNGKTGRQFYNIQNKVGKDRNTNRRKKEEDIFSRLRYGHTRLNNTLVLTKKHANGSCDFCVSPESIEQLYYTKEAQGTAALTTDLVS